MALTFVTAAETLGAMRKTYKFKGRTRFEYLEVLSDHSTLMGKKAFR